MSEAKTAHVCSIGHLCCFATVSSHTVSFDGVMGTRWLEASSATGDEGLCGDVMSLTCVSRGAPRPTVPSWEQTLCFQMISLWGPLPNKNLSPYCLENVRGSFKPVWGIQEDYKSNAMTLKRDVLNSTINFLCNLGLVIFIFWIHNTYEIVAFSK